MFKHFLSQSNGRLRYVCVIIALLVLNTVQESINPTIEADNRYQQLYRELVKAENTKMIQDFNEDQAHGFKLSPNKFLSLKNDEFLRMYATNVKESDYIQEVSLNLSSAKGSSLSSTAKGQSQSS